MIITFRDPQIFVGNLKACLLAANEDYTRPTSCIRLEARQGAARFIATDGHWMWINEIDCSIEDGQHADIVFELEDVLQIVKHVDTTRKASGWPVEIDTEKHTVQQLSSVTGYRSSARTFPPYPQILPKSVGGDRIIACFDAHLMGRIAQAFTLAAGKSAPTAKRTKDSSIGLMMHTTSATKHGPEPIIVTATSHAVVAHALVILMPMNLDVGGPEALLRKYGTEKKEEKAA